VARGESQESVRFGSTCNVDPLKSPLPCTFGGGEVIHAWSALEHSLWRLTPVQCIDPTFVATTV
jgi:hypothetical protein